ALADDGLWFTDATTNSESTEQSIPIMLTSAIPSYSVREETGLPIEDFESRNLLRLLDSGAGITVYQNFFNDCFVKTFRKCDLGSSKNPWDRVPGTNAWDRLPGIATLVFERRLGTSGGWLVDELEARGLMPIQPGLFERPQKIPSLIADLESQESSEIEGGVYYVHSPLPHPPYVYDASGSLVNHANTEWLEGGDFTATYENYRAQSAFADRRVGELMATLKDKGVYENAVIVLTSDHGIRPWLDRMTDLQAKVPLIMKVPGVIPGIVETEYQHFDFLPTVLDLLGMEPPAGIAGRSAVSPGAAATPRTRLIYEWSEPIYEYAPDSGEWLSRSP
ncbi:MAG: sulfatase-like hydrolase/transferase, partial [Dehalococcoidia bacterium]|nr:sulfatase-like hydrolase/transferase [Dehalococcoidia bacterium]